MSSTPRFTFTIRNDDRKRLLAYADNRGVKAAQVIREFIQGLPSVKKWEHRESSTVLSIED